MEVHYNEGVAIRIGPEPCVSDREVADEASAGDQKWTSLLSIEFCPTYAVPSEPVDIWNFPQCR